MSSHAELNAKHKLESFGMVDVVLHDITSSAVSSYVCDPGHALGLIGPAGAGKRYLSRYIANNLLGKHNGDGIYIISPAPGSITIEQIRDLKQYLKLIKPGIAVIKRVVIIENAQTMGDEAQNALLKVLEEPPADTVFILTITGDGSLRPTVYSRLQQIHVLPISLEQAKGAFDGNVAKSYHLSGGCVGLLSSLLRNQDHELVSAVMNAKQLMRSTHFERLLLVDSLAKDKDEVARLFYALERVIGAALVNSSGPQLERLVSSLRRVYRARLDLTASANTKLLLTDLFLSL